MCVYITECIMHLTLISVIQFETNWVPRDYARLKQWWNDIYLILICVTYVIFIISIWWRRKSIYNQFLLLSSADGSMERVIKSSDRNHIARIPANTVLFLPRRAGSVRMVLVQVETVRRRRQQQVDGCRSLMRKSEWRGYAARLIAVVLVYSTYSGGTALVVVPDWRRRRWCGSSKR